MMKSDHIITLLSFLSVQTSLQRKDQLSTSSNKFIDYCSEDMECEQRIPNIVCQRDFDCSPVPGIKTWRPNYQFRIKLLHAHNKYRNRVASGADTRGGNSEASNMNSLSYDMELETLAQCWANLFVYSHCNCSSSKEFPEGTGQNIYLSFRTFRAVDSRDDAEAVKAWYDQIAYTSGKLIDGYFEDEHVRFYGQFTQLVHAKTTHVGCAKAIKRNNVLIVCNYGLAGNVPGLEVYTRGPASSSCPIGRATKSPYYPALCGDVLVPYQAKRQGVVSVVRMRKSDSGRISRLFLLEHFCLFFLFLHLQLKIMT